MQKKTKIAGKHTLAYTKQDTINVGDTEDHIISLYEYEGTNVSSGKTSSWMVPRFLAWDSLILLWATELSRDMENFP